jgi:outer membrane protein OmpU
MALPEVERFTMKKVLLATTAIATTGLLTTGLMGAGDAAAAERISMEVHGFHQQWVVGTSQEFNDDDAGRTRQGYKLSTIDQKTNSEICFVGQTTLDNGISVGVQVELEAFTASAMIDETSLFLESERFGQLTLGVKDSVAELLHAGSPDGGVSVDDGDVNTLEMYINTAAAVTGVTNSTSLGDVFGDTNRIIYITPRYLGLQAGVSYAPNAGEDSNTTNNPNYGCGLNIGTDCAPNGNHDQIAGALNYKETFNGIGVQLSAGISHNNQVRGLAADLPAALDEGSIFGYSFGSQFTLGGFTVGGAFKQITSGRGYSDVGDDLYSLRGHSWSAGGRYEVGPYAAGVSCIRGRQTGFQDAGTGDLKHLVCALSGTYTLGPGIRLIGGLFYFDDEAETPAGPSAGLISETSDTDGWGGTVAITTSF